MRAEPERDPGALKASCQVVPLRAAAGRESDDQSFLFAEPLPGGGAVTPLRGRSQDISLPQVGFERIEIAVERRAKTAAADRAQDVGVARREHLVERLACRKPVFVLIEAVDRDAS